MDIRYTHKCGHISYISPAETRLFPEYYATPPRICKDCLAASVGAQPATPKQTYQDPTLRESREAKDNSTETKASTTTRVTHSCGHTSEISNLHPGWARRPPLLCPACNDDWMGVEQEKEVENKADQESVWDSAVSTSSEGSLHRASDTVDTTSMGTQKVKAHKEEQTIEAPALNPEQVASTLDVSDTVTTFGHLMEEARSPGDNPDESVRKFDHPPSSRGRLSRSQTAPSTSTRPVSRSSKRSAPKRWLSGVKEGMKLLAAELKANFLAGVDGISRSEPKSQATTPRSRTFADSDSRGGRSDKHLHRSNTHHGGQSSTARSRSQTFTDRDRQDQKPDKRLHRSQTHIGHHSAGVKGLYANTDTHGKSHERRPRRSRSHSSRPSAPIEDEVPAVPKIPIEHTSKIYEVPSKDVEAELWRTSKTKPGRDGFIIEEGTCAIYACGHITSDFEFPEPGYRKAVVGITKDRLCTACENDGAKLHRVSTSRTNKDRVIVDKRHEYGLYSCGHITRGFHFPEPGHRKAAVFVTTDIPCSTCKRNKDRN